jgi:protein tyrosine phosphatase
MIRVLVHHHFLSWPDMGVPDDPNQLLNLIKIYRRSDTYTRAWPLLVHCAGGVGRTGTFILTDSMYDMAEDEDHVDFLKHLSTIRNQRISLVEKPEQYEIAHRVILQAYKEGLFDQKQ